MYLRWIRFSLGAGHRAVRQALADEIVPVLAAQPGCRQVLVCGDEADGTGGFIALWDTAPQAKAAAKVVRPRLDALLTGHVLGPLETSLFEVYAHRSGVERVDPNALFDTREPAKPAP